MPDSPTRAAKAPRGQRRRRPEGVAVDGVLLLNKPTGFTSNQALQKVKRLLQARKAGHTGSLDPAATGMLPLCFGEATKICAYLLDADKTYRVTARLGEATDTADAGGKVIATADVPELTPAQWEDLLAGFVGDIEQIPPMYSALKKDGKRLYALARQGVTVDRDARTIRVHALDLLEAQGRRIAFRVHCSKGTYVRTLVEDLAKAAGTVAHTVALHRETVGQFRAEDMLDLTEAERIAVDGPDALRARLMPVDGALSRWPERRIDAANARRFVDGQPVQAGAANAVATVSPIRVYDERQGFLGVGELHPDGTLSPRRIFRAGGR